MLSEPNISYKPFWGICRPLKSWRANSPNPIQIYCATICDTRLTRTVRYLSLTFEPVYLSVAFIHVLKLQLDQDLQLYS